MTIETSYDNSQNTTRHSKMESEENTECPSFDTNQIQELSAEEHKRHLHSDKNSDEKHLTEGIETPETLTTTSQKSGFMITDILSDAAARSSAVATLAAVAVSSNSSPTSIKSSRSHTSIMAAAAAAVAENDFRARISAAAAALSAAARFTPHSILSENATRTDILQNSSVGSQLFVHPHAAAAAAAAAAAVSSGNTTITQPSINDLSGDDLSDHDSVSGKGEPSGSFDIGKIIYYPSFNAMKGTTFFHLFR